MRRKLDGEALNLNFHIYSDTSKHKIASNNSFEVAPLQQCNIIRKLEPICDYIELCIEEIATSSDPL